ncbi:helix-turn-helix domain-containing protein [Mucilaginibacter sp. Bleaf8]|uniref:helix-turn-helix domain-containing protein n=1 Tax=Mucilaginibacter sp. Bleaf8 TaxID=2834430 RepID=UPI001BD0B38D|nr:helix-turn-helix domain-containing protein [Mucilaginibacter sp. Bleaf8]MBS7566862.1 helix-turn-helix domain-containing protein [Mucilaginibacter sp. Bleaf8]
MKTIYSSSGEYLLGIKAMHEDVLCIPAQYAEYAIFFIPEGSGTFHADFGTFAFTGPVLLFATPLQVLYMEDCQTLKCTMLQFHGDFYCIEYHRKEVACNGLLFNNIYIDPVVHLTDKEASRFAAILNDIAEEADQDVPSEIVLRSYLQLFLAKSSSIKLKAIDEHTDRPQKDEQMERFRQLLDELYLTLHKPSDYAGLLAMSADNLTRRCNKYFKKNPTQLIQERIILEAKKQLHLTRQSIKEIAYNLQFQDEFYFSRFFKKITKVSPQAFRDKTGISIVADLYKE